MATVDQQAAGSEEKKAPARSLEEIQSDLDVTRSRLTENLEQLKAETKPQALGQRAADKAKEVGAGVQEQARATLMNQDGSVRAERVLAIGGAVVALLLLRKGFKARAHRKELERLSQVVWVPVPRSAVNPEYALMARNAAELSPAALEYRPQLELAGS